MRIQIGATVRSQEGEEIGRAERVVLDPSTQEVESIVVHRGLLLSRDVLVPISLVEEATEQEIRLRIPKDRVGDLSDFVSAHFEIKPPEHLASYASYAPGSILFPLVPPYGVPGEPGPYELGEVEQERAVVPSELDIAEGMLVLALDGTVGEVDEVRTDPVSDRATAIVVRARTGVKKEIEVPIELVSGIFPDHVQLSLTSEQVEELPTPVVDRYITSEKRRRRGKR